MKKWILIIAMTSLLGISACGSPKETAVPEPETASAEQAESVVSETTSAEESEETVEEEPEAAEETATVSEAPVAFTPVEGLGENYVDFENRSFAYDGKVYKLGETILQDLIDGGIPFDENDLNNVNNNVNKNYETARYTAQINDLNFLQFEFLNATDGNLTEKECVLSTVRWNTLYVPHDDYQESLNEDIREKLADCATHVCFSFPLTLTKEELLANTPEPTEQNENGTVNYTVDSEVYMGSSGYTFRFNKDTDQLEDISISWLP